MLRGIDRMAIFREPEDYERFLSILRQCKMICGFELFAWCLMENHVHLLIRAGKEPVATVIKRIGCRYVYWFNNKYDRIGHLFQDRYRSEAVETDAYFLTVLRYILQNPIKAHLESQMGDYPYTAFSAYKGFPDGLTDIDFASKYFEDLISMLVYLRTSTDENAMDIETLKKKASDAEVLTWVSEIVCDSDVRSFSELHKDLVRTSVQQFRQRGATIRQISAATGISKSNIARIIER